MDQDQQLEGYTAPRAGMKIPNEKFSPRCELLDMSTTPPTPIQDWKVWKPTRKDPNYRCTYHNAKRRDQLPYQELSQADWQARVSVVRQAQIVRYCTVNFNIHPTHLDTSNMGAKYEDLDPTVQQLYRIAKRCKEEADKFFPMFTFLGKPKIEAQGNLAPLNNFGGPVQQMKPLNTAKAVELFEATEPRFKSKFHGKTSDASGQRKGGYYDYGNDHPFTFNTRQYSIDRFIEAMKEPPDLNKIAPKNFYPGGEESWKAKRDMASRAPSSLITPTQSWKWDFELDMNVPFDFAATPSGPKPTDAQLRGVEDAIKYAIENDIFRKAYKERNFADAPAAPPPDAVMSDSENQAATAERKAKREQQKADMKARKAARAAWGDASDDSESSDDDDSDAAADLEQPLRNRAAAFDVDAEVARVVPTLNKWGWLDMAESEPPGSIDVQAADAAYRTVEGNSLEIAAKRYQAWRAFTKTVQRRTIPNTAPFDDLIAPYVPPKTPKPPKPPKAPKEPKPLTPKQLAEKKKRYEAAAALEQLLASLEDLHPYFKCLKAVDIAKAKRAAKIVRENKKLKDLKERPFSAPAKKAPSKKKKSKPEPDPLAEPEPTAEELEAMRAKAVSEQEVILKSLEDEHRRESMEEDVQLGELSADWQKKLNAIDRSANPPAYFDLKGAEERALNSMKSEAASKKFWSSKLDQRLRAVPKGKGKASRNVEETIKYLRGEGEFQGMTEEDTDRVQRVWNAKQNDSIAKLKAKVPEEGQEGYEKAVASLKRLEGNVARMRELLLLDAEERQQRSTKRKTSAANKRLKTGYFSLPFAKQMEKDQEARDAYRATIPTLEIVRKAGEAKVLQIQNKYVGDKRTMERKFQSAQFESRMKEKALQKYPDNVSFDNLEKLVKQYSEEEADEEARGPLYQSLWELEKTITDPKVPEILLDKVGKIFFRHMYNALQKKFKDEYGRYYEANLLSESEKEERKAAQAEEEEEQRYNELPYDEKVAYDQAKHDETLADLERETEVRKAAIFVVVQREEADNQRDPYRMQLIRRLMNGQGEGAESRLSIVEMINLENIARSKFLKRVSDAKKIRDGYDGGNMSADMSLAHELEANTTAMTKKKYTMFISMMKDKKSNISDKYVKLYEKREARKSQTQEETNKIRTLERQLKELAADGRKDSTDYIVLQQAIEAAKRAVASAVLSDEYPEEADLRIRAMVEAAQAFQQAIGSVEELLRMQEDKDGPQRNELVIKRKREKDEEVLSAIDRMKSVLNPSLRLVVDGGDGQMTSPLEDTYGPFGALSRPQGGPPAMLGCDILHPDLQPMFQEIVNRKEEAKRLKFQEDVTAKAKKKKTVQFMEEEEDIEDEQRLDDEGFFAPGMVLAAKKGRIAKMTEDEVNQLPPDELQELLKEQYEKATDEFDSDYVDKMNEFARKNMREMGMAAMGVEAIRVREGVEVTTTVTDVDDWVASRGADFNVWQDEQGILLGDKFEPVAPDAYKVWEWVISVWGVSPAYEGKEQLSYQEFRRTRGRGANSGAGWSKKQAEEKGLDGITDMSWTAFEYVRDPDDPSKYLYEKRDSPGVPAEEGDADSVACETKIIRVPSVDVPSEFRNDFSEIYRDDILRPGTYSNYVKPHKILYVNADGSWKARGAEQQFIEYTNKFNDAITTMRTRNTSITVAQFPDPQILSVANSRGFVKIDEEKGLAFITPESRIASYDAKDYDAFITHVKNEVMQKEVEARFRAKGKIFNDDEEDDVDQEDEDIDAFEAGRLKKVDKAAEKIADGDGDEEVELEAVEDDVGQDEIDGLRQKLDNQAGGGGGSKALQRKLAKKAKEAQAKETSPATPSPMEDDDYEEKMIDVVTKDPATAPSKGGDKPKRSAFSKANTVMQKETKAKKELADALGSDAEDDDDEEDDDFNEDDELEEEEEEEEDSGDDDEFGDEFDPRGADGDTDDDARTALPQDQGDGDGDDDDEVEMTDDDEEDDDSDEEEGDDDDDEEEGEEEGDAMEGAPAPQGPAAGDKRPRGVGAALQEAMSPSTPLALGKSSHAREWWGDSPTSVGWWQ